MTSSLAEPVPEGTRAAAQIEFPLRLAVCAWCKPQARGSGLEVISHGICPRHLQKLKLEADSQLPKRARRSVRPAQTSLGALTLPF